MTRPTASVPAGAIPPGAIGHNRGVVRPNYAFFPPEGVLASRLPHYDKTVARVLAAPALGARFVQFILEIQAGGGTNRPVCEAGVQHFYFVLEGTCQLAIGSETPSLLPKHGFAYVPPGTPFTLRAADGQPVRVLGLRKRYDKIDLPEPEPIISHVERVPVTNHTGSRGRGFQHLLPFGDMRFDFEMNLMHFETGTCFPAVETHVMEHGLFMLEGQGLYYLGTDWHEIWAGDFIWMGAYCPQQFYPTGFGDAVYLLYKDMNREIPI